MRLTKEYAHPLDSGMWERTRHWGIYASIGAVAYGRETNCNEYRESGLETLERVFQK